MISSMKGSAHGLICCAVMCFWILFSPLYFHCVQCNSIKRTLFLESLFIYIYIYIYIYFAGSHITLQPKTCCPLKLSRVEPGQYLDGRPPGKTSQVTYVTMVPRVGNETLRPLGDTMGERLQRDSCLKKHMKKHHPLAGDSPWRHYRRDHNIRTAGRIHHPLLRLKLASEAWPQSLGDAVSRSPLGEPWLHT